MWLYIKYLENIEYIIIIRKTFVLRKIHKYIHQVIITVESKT